MTPVRGPLARVNTLINAQGSVRSIAVLRMLLGPITLLHLRPFLSNLRDGVIYSDRFYDPYAGWYPEAGPGLYKALLLLAVAACVLFSVGLFSPERRVRHELRGLQPLPVHNTFRPQPGVPADLAGRDDHVGAGGTTVLGRRAAAPAGAFGPRRPLGIATGCYPLTPSHHALLAPSRRDHSLRGPFAPRRPLGITTGCWPPHPRSPPAVAPHTRPASVNARFTAQPRWQNPVRAPARESERGAAPDK